VRGKKEKQGGKRKKDERRNGREGNVGEPPQF